MSFKEEEAAISPRKTQPVEKRTLIELARRHLGADPQAIGITPITTGKHNASYWVDSSEGRFVLRLAPPDDSGLLFYERLMMRQEPEIHALIRERTSVPVAEIVAYDFSRTHTDRDYVLMATLPGTTLLDTPLTQPQRDQVLFQLGAHLRQIHALTAPDCLGTVAYGYLGAHRPMEPQPTWADAFQIMWGKLLDDVAASGCYSQAEAQAMRDLLTSHRRHFEGSIAPRLLHMDLWGQNILVDGAGNLTGLVDFDRALWGDVQCEVAVLDYCGISEPAFWRGYGSEPDSSLSARIRRQFYLLYEVQKYMPICIWRRADPAGASRYREQSLALAATLGLKR